MPAVRYRLTTLGCRVNHAETRELESVLLSRGLQPAGRDEPAHLEVVHTCSVTGSAAARSRQAVRRAARHGRLSDDVSSHGATPLAPQVLVTGCYASTDPKEASRLAGGPHRVVPADGPGGTLAARFARQVDLWLDRHRPLPTVRTAAVACCPQSPTPLPPEMPRGRPGRHVRAELKVQDGCDAHCTFCIIPRIRRTLRSKRVADAVEEARRLVDLGHRELVLTGIFIGAYGHRTALRHRQPAAGTPLADLLDAVARVPGLLRLRLSSMEPGDVDEPLLDAMVANGPTVVPHLHLPLQSGSDAVLRRMNRQYRVGDYLEMIDRVNAALATPDGLPPAITTDVICGFPGETVEDFERTVAVARRTGYLHMHVFPYSPRPNTAAARWRDRFVPAAEIRRRVRRLIDLERDPTEGLSILYRRRLLGRTVRLIVEQPDARHPGFVTGRCDHYALVHLRADRPRGSVVTARICGVTADRTIGRTEGATIPLTVVH